MTKQQKQFSFDTLRLANIARQKEWVGNDDGRLTLAFKGVELAGEAGEVCNVIKKLERERLGIRGSRDTVAHLAQELADVIISVDLIAMEMGIDLGPEIMEKFNSTSFNNKLETLIVAGEVTTKKVYEGDM